MLSKKNLRASQRVDYSGYVDEDEDEDNITYEDNLIPHDKPQRQAQVRRVYHNALPNSCNRR